MDVAVRHVRSATSVNGSGLLIRLPAALGLTDDRFYDLCRLNRELRIERTAAGELSIMAPAGGDSSDRNAEITFQLRRWAKRNGAGRTFDSSGGFRLPSGAVRSPDAAWIGNARLTALTDEQRKGFIPLCPDFVVELRSASDSLPALQDKMREYMNNGAGLGWLIDPLRGEVFVYRPDGSVECLQAPEHLSADPPMAGFRLDLHEIWSSLTRPPANQ
jgi:Uma2 family endonuclease